MTEGDQIRVYDNTTKEQLYEIALKEDKEDRFRAIELASKLWKTSLLKYFAKKQFCTIEDLFTELKSNGLKVKNIITLRKWLDPNDSVKFPQSLKDLYAIKTTLIDEDLNELFEEVKIARKAYNSILIALGKDLSEEITNYILTGEKGKILNRLSESQIHEIVQKNAPIRKIKKIKLVESEDEN